MITPIVEVEQVSERHGGWWYISRTVRAPDSSGTEEDRTEYLHSDMLWRPSLLNDDTKEFSGHHPSEEAAQAILRTFKGE